MEHKLKNVNATEILNNIRNAVEGKNPLFDVMVTVFDEENLNEEERLAICSEALISLDKRIHFDNIVRQVQSKAFKDFGHTFVVSIVEGLMLSYLARNISISFDK